MARCAAVCAPGKANRNSHKASNISGLVAPLRPSCSVWAASAVLGVVAPPLASVVLSCLKAHELEEYVVETNVGVSTAIVPTAPAFTINVLSLITNEVTSVPRFLA